MTLRRAAWICLLAALAVGAIGWFAWKGAYLVPLGAVAFVALILASGLAMAARQMPSGTDDGNAS
jgi:hypothetical protein